MKYDPIDAFFSGLSSGPLRALFGIATMIGALTACMLVANFAPGEWYEEPLSWGSGVFIFILTIFAYWNDLGGWFALGLLSFVGQWGALYAFVVSDGGKAWWFVLLLLSTICYFPVAIKGPWWFLIVGFAVLTLLFWLLPLAFAGETRTKKSN